MLVEGAGELGVATLGDYALFVEDGHDGRLPAVEEVPCDVLDDVQLLQVGEGVLLSVRTIHLELKHLELKHL